MTVKLATVTIENSRWIPLADPQGHQFCIAQG